MEIWKEQIGEILVCRYRGEGLYSEWELAGREIMEDIENGAQTVLIDWTKAPHVDSSSLQLLVNLHKMKKKIPGFDFVLLTDVEMHIQVLTSVGFDKFIEHFSDEEVALSRLRSGIKTDA